MLAKLSSKNQLTIPKAIVSQMDSPEYFEVTLENGRIILTPVSMNVGDSVRRKLSALGITEQDIEDAVDWCRKK